MQRIRRVINAIVRANNELIRRTFALTVCVATYSAIVVYADQHLVGQHVSIRANLHAMLGTVLGIFLAFRTGTAYDRWWEGRKLWGQLVNDSRNLAIKVTALPRVEPTEQRRIGKLLVRFARALRDHLRGGVRPWQITNPDDSVSNSAHGPIEIAAMIRTSLVTWRTDGRIDGFDDVILDVHARALMDICGACERIRKTPLARTYLYFIRQCIFLYLFTLPWALVDDWNYWCIPATSVIAYFMIGVELLAESIEEPFGHDVDDLRLDEICDGIENSINDIQNSPPSS